MGSVITHEGEVIKALDGIIYVRILQKAACSECHARSACHVADSKEKVIEVAGPISRYQAGDKVVVKASSVQGLKAVWFAFLIPLILIFVSLLLLLNLISNEAIAIVVAISVVGLYYYILYLSRDRLKDKFVFEIENIEHTT